MSSKSMVPVAGSIQATANKQGITVVDALVNADCVAMVDASGSMDTTDCEGGISRRTMSQRELERLQAEYEGRIVVIEFSDHAGFRLDGILRNNVGDLTNMVAAMSLAKQFDGTGMKFVIISDGLPDSPERTIDFAQSLTTPINTVFCGDSMGWEGQRGIEFLKRLAAATHGNHMTAAKTGQLAAPAAAVLGLPAPKGA